MNATVRAVVRAATGHGVTVVAYRDGFTGLINGWTMELNDRSVGSQMQRGGTFIGTSRSEEFKTPPGRARAASQLRTDAVDGLIVVGGDGSFKGALTLQEEHGLAVVGVPGTIDNDVYGTDETIGFDTAVNTAMDAIDRIRDTSEATGMTFFVEVMGRTCGAIAMNAALASGAAGVLVPEEHDEAAALIERLRESRARGKRSNIVIVAEGEEEGGAFGVAGKIAGQIDCDYRVVVLGHIQRGGRPTARDRIIASQMGAGAVDCLAAGRRGLMVGMWRSEVVEVPFADVVTHAHGAARLEILELAQRLSG